MNRRDPSFADRAAFLLLVAVTYCLLARLSLLLALPPGYATAVWPAAGVALVAVLLRGRAAAAGVVLGSLGANLWASLDTTSINTVHTSVCTAGLLGIGAAAQAVVGAWLIRRVLKGRHELIADRHIIGFLLLGGPLACVIGAICGMATLHLLAGLPTAAIPFSAFTWWIGDSIGVVIFAPLTLMVCSNADSIWRSRRLTVGLPLCLTFASVVVVFVMASRAEQARDVSQFDRQGGALIEAIRARLQSSTEKLVSVAGLFGSSHDVDRSEFRTFIRKILRPEDGVKAMSYAQRVDRAALDDFERNVRASGIEDYQVRDFKPEPGLRRVGDRQQYFPILYTEPLDTNRAVLGLDLVSRPQQLASIERARDSGEPSASPPLKLVQSANQIGFVVFMPIYRTDAATQTVEQRRAALIGYNTAAFFVNELVVAATGKLDREGAHIDLADVTDAAPQPLLPSADQAETGNTHALMVEQTFDVGGRRWQIRVTRPALYAVTHRSFQSWAVLVGGLALTSLLGGFLLILTGRTFSIESLVRVRTDDLTRANAQLASEQQAIRTMNEQLCESRDAAECAASAKSEFLANMSHEIRTPMTAIVGFAELLSSPDCVAEERATMAQSIRTNGQHLLQVISDILDISKIDSGQLTLEQTRCNLNQLCREVLNAIRPLALKKQLALTLECDEAADAAVSADPFRLRQVLLNLLSNAIKFTSDSGCVHLSTRVLKTEAQSLTAELTVTDTGIGMSDEQISKLFRPFSQADTSTTRRFGGTGLGLAIVKRIVEQIGGAIEVTSLPGRGSSFVVRVTLAKFTAATTDLPSQADAGVDHSPATLRGRVLIVDDQPDNRRLIRALLQQSMLELNEAGNGQQAIALAMAASERGEPFDAIIMDMQMPEMDGYAAAAQLRRQGFAGPVIALTAHTSSQDREKCLRAGCSDYLAKPIQASRLIDSLVRSIATAQPPALTELDSSPIRSSRAQESLIAPLLPAYLLELVNLAEQVKTALAAQDRDPLRRLLHTIKGSGGSYGYDRVTFDADAALRDVVGCQSNDIINDSVGRLLSTIRRIDGLPKATSDQRSAA